MSTICIEVTPEPTEEVTPEPTEEITPAPTEEPTPEPTEEPTPTPVTPVCGGDQFDEDGFPIIDMDTANCGPDEERPVVNWSPVDVGGAICPDWLVYHTRMTGDWEIFRLGELPGDPDADANLSKGFGRGIIDMAPSRSPDAGWIAFVSNRDGNWEIYVATVDGEFVQRVTYNDTSLDLDPVWSPDGSRIAYESNVDGNWEIRVVDVATGAKYRVTDHPANDINPFWSPDGTKLVFQSDRDDGLWQIYELDLSDITNPTMTRLSQGEGDDHDPSYSHDGTMIAFRSYREDVTGEQSAIYTMSADGQNVERVSELGGDARNHSWSSDDSLIGYQTDLMNGIFDIYVYQVETGQTRLITENEGETYAGVLDVSPTWYCDSSTIVFTSDMSGNNDLYSVDALPIDGEPYQVDQETTQLTDDPENDRDPQNTPPEENASRQGALPPKWTPGG